MAQRAVLLLSDLPAWGRVALASAVPLLEAAGFQACSLPTALLSTHGAYPGFVLEPQTGYLERAWAHLSTLNLKFAGVGVGFVGHSDQFALLTTVVQAVREGGGLVLVDPILGDHGRRYGLLTEDYVPAFRDLVARADVITPNLTEAALLLGEDPRIVPEPAEARRWLGRLAALGPDRVVLTSAPFAPGGRGREHTGVLWRDADGSEGQVVHRRHGQGIPGTGDALAARLLAFLLQGRPFAQAVRRAVKGTLADLARTQRSGRPPLWGPEGPLVP